MTKYILHGGATRKPLEGNKKFFREILNGIPQKAKVLLVYFARKESEKQQNYSELVADDTKNFRSNSPDKEIELQVASEDPEKFREQAKWAGVIYVRGGDTKILRERVNRIPDFADLIKGKVYAGSSAGMYLVCKYYYSNDRQQIEEGLGILPIKGLAHWTEDKQDILKRLKETGEDLPIYKLPEGEFVVIEQ